MVAVGTCLVKRHFLEFQFGTLASSESGRESNVDCLLEPAALANASLDGRMYRHNMISHKTMLCVHCKQ